jgi:hypothetical protein
VRLVDAIERFATVDVRQHATFTVVTGDNNVTASAASSVPRLAAPLVFAESSPPRPTHRPASAGGARPYPACSLCKRSLKYKGKNKTAPLNRFCCMTASCPKQKQIIWLG